MSETTYELRGPGVQITYRQGELSVDGDASYLQDRQFTGDGLEESAIGIGRLVTAVLVPVNRSGSEITLTLLLPDAAPEDGVGAQATGVAVITNQGDESTVRQHYEVRPLSGSVSS
ncbi:hypothetical protein [Nonomuraea zeae]|uniref:Uncharacterized protein n=1 Tax=Nonomuraea zeae TaxID=1642303 RepID=A0A5S4G8X5_9ACTN|nr:hypothetical protein [Nonomuraea zeae]TMR29393.1 hypothetical protein ETD85_32605 [Nonomuraea zeae]